MKVVKKHGINLLGKYIVFVERNKIFVMVVFLLLSVLSVIYTVNNLGINTDTKNMLSPDLIWRQLDNDYEQNFPQYSSTIIVVVESDTPDQATDATKILHQRLSLESSLFKSVYYPKSLPNIRESGLLYLDIDELQNLVDNLSKIQPFLYNLTDDPSLSGLFSMLSGAMDAIENGDNIELDPVLSELNKVILSRIQSNSYRLSWQKLMGENEVEKSVYREFIILQPILDYSNLLPATATIEFLHQMEDELNLDTVGAKIRLTGSVVLAHEEMLSVARGVEIALVLSLIIVSLFLAVGLRSARLVFFTLITLAIGLILTAAFATMTVGDLNLISVAFAVLYIGLGVDFAIHYCLRYRELMIYGATNEHAIEKSSLNVGSSLFLCAITTAIGFFAFIPTNYHGVAELGWISGFGMFISLIVTLTILPSLLSIFPLDPQKLHDRSIVTAIPRKISTFPLTHAKSIKAISLIIVVLLAGLMMKVHFDYNTLNLQDPDNESVKTYHSLLADSDTSPWTGVVVAYNHDDALHTTKNLGSLHVVDNIVWLDEFIPKDQEEKLAIIDELNLLLLGGISLSNSNPPISLEQQHQALVTFYNKLNASSLTKKESTLHTLQQVIKLYLDHLSSIPEKDRATSLAELNNSVIASLPGRIELLNASLNPSLIDKKTLPVELTERWQSADGRYLMEIFPVENLQDNEAMRRFVDQTRNADSRVIGSPVINMMASDAVIKAFTQAFLYSFCAITLLLLIFLPHKRDAFYILGPLLAAAICTAGVSVLLDIPLNFANIIALPLLLGMGVDSGIHMLHRFRTTFPKHNNVLATSSARAVMVSGFTTIGSIGNLVFSPHRGMASMGELLTIGIGITLFSMLVLLPSILSDQIQTANPD